MGIFFLSIADLINDHDDHKVYLEQQKNTQVEFLKNLSHLSLSSSFKQ